MNLKFKDYIVLALYVILGAFIGYAICITSEVIEQNRLSGISIVQANDNRFDNLQTQIDLFTKKNEINLSKVKIEVSNIKTDSLKKDVESLIRDSELENNLTEQIKKVPNLITAKKAQTEIILQQVNIMIHNISGESLGSGVTLKYKGKFYVLTAGHMADVENTDSLELWENGQKVCDLEIVKHDFTLDNEITTDEEFFMLNDLMLLKPKDDIGDPTFYTELADYEPRTGAEVYIVGNPMGIEDVVSDGRVIAYRGNFIEYIDHTYFGNSGGGVYTRDGKLVGIVSHLDPLQPKKDVPPYMVYRAVRLDTIKNFLEGVE